jgi:hypothetical protein
MRVFGRAPLANIVCKYFTKQPETDNQIVEYVNIHVNGKEDDNSNNNVITYAICLRGVSDKRFEELGACVTHSFENEKLRFLYINLYGGISFDQMIPLGEGNPKSALVLEYLHLDYRCIGNNQGDIPILKTTLDLEQNFVDREYSEFVKNQNKAIKKNSGNDFAIRPGMGYNPFFPYLENNQTESTEESTTTPTTQPNKESTLIATNNEFRSISETKMPRSVKGKNGEKEVVEKEKKKGKKEGVKNEKKSKEEGVKKVKKVKNKEEGMNKNKNKEEGLEKEKNKNKMQKEEQEVQKKKQKEEEKNQKEEEKKQKMMQKKEEKKLKELQKKQNEEEKKNKLQNKKKKEKRKRKER